MQSKQHDSELAFMMPVDEPGSCEYKVDDAEASRKREERQAAQVAQVSHLKAVDYLHPAIATSTVKNFACIDRTAQLV